MDLLQQIQKLGASRAGQSISAGTQTAGVTTIAGSALQNAGTGYLFCRAYSEIGRINTISSTVLPDAFTGKPIAATLLSSINLSNNYFAGVNANYSLRIVGSVQPPSTGNYIMRLTSSDGARLFFDSYKVIDSWKSGTSVAKSPVVMYAGNWYAITIEHCTIANSERLLLEWSLDGVAFTAMTHVSDGTNFQFAFDSSENQGSHAASLRIAGQTYMADALSVAASDRALSPGTITYTGTITNLQSDLASTYTTSLWLEFAASASLQTICGFGGRSIQINGSNRIVLTPSNGPLASSTVLTPAAPVHLVVVTTPTTYSLYVNGILDANYNGTNSSGTLSSLSSSVLAINPSPAMANAALLDELAVWLSALDAPSVSRVFNNGRKVSLKDVTNTTTLYSSLYLWYTFNDDGLAYFSDKGPRGNNLNHGLTVTTSASFIPNAESLSVVPGTVLHTHNMVGFGTPNPGAQVHIAGRTSASTFYNGGLLCVNSVDSGNSGVVVKSGLSPTRPGGNSWLSFDQAGIGGWSIGQDASDSRKLKMVGNNSFLTSAPAITIDTSNRVGINQPNPLYALDVAGTVNLTGALFQNGNAFMTSQWTTSNNNIYYSSGNVGIGTNLPAFALDVAGSSRISGSLTSGSITTKQLSVGLATPGQLFDVRGPSNWGQQRVIPATDGSETSIGFYRYSNVGQALVGDTWVAGHNAAQSGLGNFGIGCYAPSGTLSMLTLTTGTYVGIANPSPQFTLDVGGNINFTGALYKGGTPYVGSQWTTTGTNLYFAGGNVGIAKTNPLFALDVGGTISGSALTVVNGASISGNFAVGTTGQLSIDPRGNLNSSGIITNNVNNALVMRVFDETGVYSGIGTLTTGVPLPAPYLSKPISDSQLTALNMTNAAFGTVTGGYSLRIAGYVQPPATGTYLFRATYQEGLTLFLDTKKLIDSWKYTGGTSVSYGTLTMYQNVWSPLVIEHAAATSGERLLIEWSSNAGTTYATLAAGTTSTTFIFGYDIREAPATMMGTSYMFGKANYSDLGIFNAGISLPNTSFFSGNSSELNNDAGYIKSSATLSGNVNIGNTGTVVQLRTSASQTNSYTLTMPLALPQSPQALVSDLAGNLSFTPVVYTGCILTYISTTAPFGWLSCDGSAISRTTFSALFALVSTTFGAGDGSMTFNLPDLRGRAPIGAGQGTNLSSRALATVGGEEGHTLSSNELPSHSHGVSDPGHTHGATGYVAQNGFGGPQWCSAPGNPPVNNLYTNASTTGITIQNTGGGAGHNVMQPYLVLNYIIKY